MTCSVIFHLFSLSTKYWSSGHGNRKWKHIRDSFKTFMSKLWKRSSKKNVSGGEQKDSWVYFLFCFVFIFSSLFLLFFVLLLYFPFFLVGGLHPLHMEIPRWGGESELYLLAYATATAMQDLSCVCNHWATAGTPVFIFSKCLLTCGVFF